MEVVLDINTVQTDSSGEKDTVNVVSIGHMKENEHFDMISYEESEMVGLKGNKTVLKIQEDSVTMIRYGKNTTNMYFEETVVSNSIYNTDYGIFRLEIDTKKLEIQKNKDRYIYYIKIDYDLEIQNLFKGKNILEIKVKQVR